MRNVADSQQPPVLTQSRGLWRGIGSKSWIPKNTVERVGAFVLGILMVAGGLAIIAASFGIRNEFEGLISSPPVALIFSLFVVMIAIVAACFGIWLGGRLVKGSFRPTPTEN
jgi:hypothetical protein